MPEIWKPVLDFEDLYEVSSFGRIRSKTTKQILKQNIHSKRGCARDKYYRISLCRCGKKYEKSTHTLVLSTFYSRRPRRMQCRHLDGNSLNNKSTNLRWGTRKENMQDRSEHGTTICTLTKARVLYIRKIYRRGCNFLGMMNLAQMYGVRVSTIYKIIQKKTWTHIL